MEPIALGPLAVWVHTVPKPKARCLLIHGISEHSGRHLNTVRALNDAGFEVVRFDLRGSGRSGGARQHVDRFEEYVDDTASVFNWICRELPDLPLYIQGHSLGGAVAIYFTAFYQSHLDGLLLCAPAYLPGDSIPKVMLTVGKALSRFLPSLRLPKNVTPTGISRDPKVVEEYQRDPLAIHFNTLRQGAEILRALKDIPREMGKIHIPVVIFHGSHDSVIKMEGSHTLICASASADRCLHIMPNGFHELHNDLDKEEYLGLVVRWLAKHVAGETEAKQATRRKRKAASHEPVKTSEVAAE